MRAHLRIFVFTVRNSILRTDPLRLKVAASTFLSEYTTGGLWGRNCLPKFKTSIRIREQIPKAIFGLETAGTEKQKWSYEPVPRLLEVATRAPA